MSALNLNLRGEAGERHVRRGDLMALAAAAHPAHHLHLIGGGNVLAKLWLGSTPAFCQGKLNWTLITTP